MDCFGRSRSRRRRGEDECIEMGEMEQGENANDELVPWPEPEPQIEIEIKDLVGVYSLKNLPESLRLKPQDQESSHINYSPLIECIRAQECTKELSFTSNRITILFCSPGAIEENKAGVLFLKELFHQIQQNLHHNPSRPPPPAPFKIILLDAHNPHSLKQSFTKVAQTCLPNKENFLDEENSPAEETVNVNELYKEMNSLNSKKDQSLFIFFGAGSFTEIKGFLPHGNQQQVLLPFCQFLVTTSSKTDEWEWESRSEECAIKKILLFDKEMIEFDWEGVHSASKLPASFQPVPDFTGRAEIMSQLLQRFQTNSPSPVQHCDCCINWKKRQVFLSTEPAPPPAPPSYTLTLISGVAEIGKTELVKQFLSTHHQLFAKVVLVKARDEAELWCSFKTCAYNLGLYSHSLIEGATEQQRISFLLSQITLGLQRGERVLFVFDAAYCLEDIEHYLPRNSVNSVHHNCDVHVIVTSGSRNWEKEDIEFYRDNNYDFQEIPLFQGLSLEETHEFCSKILPKNRILYNPEDLDLDLDRSIKELYNLTGGFPLLLQHLARFISKSSRSSPEWTGKIHILNFLSSHIQNFREQCPFLATAYDVCEREDSEDSLLVFQILCLMIPNPDQDTDADAEELTFDFVLLCYFYFEHKEPFQPPPQEYEPEAVEIVEQLLRVLELSALIQIEREDGKLKRIHMPHFFRESMRQFVAYPEELYTFLHGETMNVESTRYISLFISPGSFIPFELSLGVSLFVFGLALTKLESVYFGWNMELSGMKLVGYRAIHLLANVTHMATLVFCSGMVSVVFPWFIFVISSIFFLTAAAWIHSRTSPFFGWNLPDWRIFKAFKIPYMGKEELLTFLASFHPGFVGKGRNPKLEATSTSKSKHEFVSARLGHDLLFLQRRPRTVDIIYLFVFLSSVLISACAAIYIYCTVDKSQGQGQEIPMTTETEKPTEWWAPSFPVIPTQIQKYSLYFFLWLPLLFVWQVLRQLLNKAYLKFSKVPHLTEDYILNDPEGILRYPAHSELFESIGWVQKRLYCQMRQGHLSASSETLEPELGQDDSKLSFFSAAWQKVEQTAESLRQLFQKFKLEIDLFSSFKLICKGIYFGLAALLFSLLLYQMTFFLKFPVPLFETLS